MNKVRDKFVLYAMLSVFALLTVLLTVINGINFAMVGNDADMLTQMICDKHGAFSENDLVYKDPNAKRNSSSQTSDVPQPKNQFGGRNRTNMGPMGPESPDMDSSLRYFTYAFKGKDSSRVVAFNISAVDQTEAQQWAKSLMNEQSTGWTHGTYRYRVYHEGSRTFVTVIDQGRELLPSYRILLISVCGEIMVLILSYVILRLVGKRLFAPLEEADRKQKKFIANIENEFKLPLTVISADTELIEKENGPSDCTRSINRQVRKMTALVKDIGTLAIFEESDPTVTKVNLSSTLSYVLDSSRAKFKEKNITLTEQIEDDIIIDGRDEALRRMMSELVKNSLRYAKTEASFKLWREKDRIFLTQSNDADLPDGSADQCFDRFTVLSNADGESVGLGLSNVKDIVKEHNGRVSAQVTDGTFTLRAAL